jgi:hypothetical protein
MTGSRNRRLSRGSIAIALLAGILAAPLHACPICASRIPEPTLAERLSRSEAVVIAEASELEPGRYRVTAVVKGPASAGDLINVRPRLAASGPEKRGAPAVILMEWADRHWSYVGTVGTEAIPLVRRLSVSVLPGPAERAQRLERLSMFADLLQHPEPLIAEAAYAELSRTSYEDLRLLAAAVPRARVRTWLATPSLASRQPLYLLLLGVAGDAEDAEYVDRRIAASHRSGQSENLAALLAADVELRGSSRVTFIERAYLADRTRTGDELQAALLALSVHGNAPGAVSRERVVAAYRLFIRERKPMAYFVAPDLAAWKDWGATRDYVALLKSDSMHYASRIAIVNYLRANPAPDRMTAQALRDVAKPPL